MANSHLPAGVAGSIPEGQGKSNQGGPTDDHRLPDICHPSGPGMRQPGCRTAATCGFPVEPRAQIIAIGITVKVRKNNVTLVERPVRVIDRKLTGYGSLIHCWAPFARRAGVTGTIVSGMPRKPAPARGGRSRAVAGAGNRTAP